MDEVGCAQLGEEGWYDIGKEDDALGHIWADEIECGGEDDHVEDIINQTWCNISDVQRQVLLLIVA